MKRILIVLMICVVSVGCGSKKKIVTTKKKSKNTTETVVIKPKTTDVPETETVVELPKTTTYANATEAYIANYTNIAMEEMRKYKIPASITLAQGILESGSGKGRLAVEANNHFGIKCHGWTGDKIHHDDDASQECFRSYDHANSSFEDHSSFLTSRSRYSNLFDLKQDDYEGWAKGLRAAGYATDRKYPEKLISLIERYQLYKLDDAVLGQDSKEVVNISEVKHEIVKGDTLYSLSKKYNTSVVELKRLNKMNNNELRIGQILIIKSN